MNKTTQKAKKIKLLVCDIDGVLTDGKIYTSDKMEFLKAFNVKDGLGIKMLLSAGIDVAIITGRSSDIVKTRMKELHVEIVKQGIKNKTKELMRIVTDKKILLENVAYIGDDLPDYASMQLVGLKACPQNAIKTIKNICDFVCTCNGGEGAVRELTDLILQAQGKMPKILQDMFSISQKKPILKV